MLAKWRAPLTAKPSALAPPRPKSKDTPTLEELIDRHDYIGAAVLLEFQLSSEEGKNDLSLKLWLAYAYFHAGEVNKSAEIYEQIIREAKESGGPVPADFETYLAICYFYMEMYEQAVELVQRCPDESLKNRVLLLAAHKTNDTLANSKEIHDKMSDGPIDKLVVSCACYLSAAYEDAVSMYRAILEEHPEWIALNVYIALCYYKLELYDASNKFLSNYLAGRPDSAVTANLRACTFYKMYDKQSGKSAEAEIKVLQDLIASKATSYGEELVKHNLVVFRDGENAVSVLTPLIDVIPEARLNLIVYHLRKEQYTDAFALAENLPEPRTPVELIVRGITYMMIGQTKAGSERFLELGLDDLRRVGESRADCDTVTGRQCMAAVHFHEQKWDAVCIYLNSIKPHVAMDDPLVRDPLCWNWGVAMIMNGDFDQGLQLLTHVQNAHLKQSFAYQALTAHTYIWTGRSKLAWDMYHDMENSADVNAMLLLIANDCYQVGAFYYAALAFDVLHRLYPNAEYWEGKRGACCGVFQQVVLGTEDSRALGTMVKLLASSEYPEAASIIDKMRSWAKTNGVSLS